MTLKSSNKEIINRCRIACKQQTLQSFAERIGVSKQILTAAAKLKKPPLTIICKTAELTGVSYDWLITGKRTSGSVPHLNDPGLMSRIGFDHEWVEETTGVAIANLRFLDANGGNTIYVIAMTGYLGTSGKYVFDLNGSLSIYDCKTRVDGSFVIDGEGYPGDVPKPVGKVVGVFTIC